MQYPVVICCKVRVVYLYAEERRPLLVEYVPAVEAAVPPRGEEDGGPRGAPAAVGEVLGVGAGPHDGRLLDVLGPDARAPVAHGKKVLQLLQRNFIFLNWSGSS